MYPQTYRANRAYYHSVIRALYDKVFLTTA